MSNLSRSVGCAVLALLVAGASGLAQEPQVETVILTGGFGDHVVPAAGGRVDWTNGYILGEGVGYGEGTDKQQELLALQAARVTAVRNSVALARGVRIDASGTVAGLRDGHVRIEGLVRGHEVVEQQWFPDRDPPEARVVVHVPLWGISGMAKVFMQTHQARLTQARDVRRPLIVEQADVTDFVLVIDARGTAMNPSLFPAVRGIDGAVLYDLNTLPSAWAGRVPLARFVESDESFEDLQAAAASGEPLRFRLVSYQATTTTAQAASQPSEPTTQPTSQPTRRRAKRRMVVQAAEVAGQEKTEIVLTREDVDRIRRSPGGASALRNAHVVVVVDSAAAGTEGRLLPKRETWLVLGEPDAATAIHGRSGQQ